MFNKKILITMVSACILLLELGIGPRSVLQAQAQPPAQTESQAGLTIPYPGQLTTDDGKPAADGAYDFIFSLYDAPEGGNLIWSETQTGVKVQGGTFAVILGSIHPVPDSVKHGELWLEVSVRGPQDTAAIALSPRQQLSSVSLSSPSSPMVVGTCPHNHFGESWSGSSPDAGLIVTNSGTGDGMRGYTSAAGVNWAGIFGVNTNTGAGGPGTYGYSVNQAGVFGIAKSGTPLTYLPGGPTGVYGIGPNGVYGYAAGTSAGDGVVGTTTATGMSGIYGFATNSFGVTGQSTNSFGLQGRGGGDASGTDAIGDLWLDGERGEIMSSMRLNLSSNWNTNIVIDADNNDTSGEFGVYANDSMSPIMTVNQSGTLWVQGNLTASGTKPALVQTGVYGQRLLYSMESPEVWFEDLGTATLVNGELTVAIEPMFAETVSLKDYKVFLTPIADQPVLLYVASKTSAGFVVKGVSLDGQPASCSFDYRIVAKRLGYETVRMQQPEQGQPTVETR